MNRFELTIIAMTHPQFAVLRAIAADFRDTVCILRDQGRK